jgi:pyridoxal phosphate enzyme (YggS family)
MSIADNLENVILRIKNSTRKSGIHAPLLSDNVKLVGVSKTKPASAIREAYDGGLRVFGENYLQESLEKMQQLSDLDIEWHFIGPIQSNKTLAIATHFDWVESVDRLKIAQRLSKQRPSDIAPLNILLQVNINNEETKSGFLVEEVMPVAKQINQLPQLSLRGLMAIPNASQTELALRNTFNTMCHLFQALQAINPKSVDTLSMGMSDDFETAIEEGATLVRVGSAIFGARQYH